MVCFTHLDYLNLDPVTGRQEFLLWLDKQLSRDASGLMARSTIGLSNKTGEVFWS
jgi:hypothetical protein